MHIKVATGFFFGGEAMWGDLCDDVIFIKYCHWSKLKIWCHVIPRAMQANAYWPFLNCGRSQEPRDTTTQSQYKPIRRNDMKQRGHTRKYLPVTKLKRGHAPITCLYAWVARFSRELHVLVLKGLTWLNLSVTEPCFCAKPGKLWKRKGGKGSQWEQRMLETYCRLKQ